MFALILLDLTLHEVIAGIPHDAGAIVVYVLLSLFVGLTIAGSVKKRPRGPRPPGGQHPPEPPEMGAAA
ncbi:MAG: hypothetical protein WD737_12825 [Gemmatimonadota bacterium]